MPARPRSTARAPLRGWARAVGGIASTHAVLAAARTCGLLAAPGCESPVQEPISFELIVKGARPASDVAGSTALAYRTFSDADAWSEFWGQSFAEPIPSVRFEDEFVLCVDLGTKRTGGHGVEVRDIGFEPETGTLQVVLELQEPRPDEMVIQALTVPYAVYRVRAPRADFDRRAPQLRFLRRVGTKRQLLEARRLDPGANEPR